MASWKMLEVHYSLVSYTVYTVNYISYYGASSSVLFESKGISFPCFLMMSSYFAESKVSLLVNIFIIVKVMNAYPNSA